MKKNGERLSEMLESAVLTGEVPYQANRQAMRAFDVTEDVDRGNRELDVLLSGIDSFIGELREVENAARSVAKRASSFL
jgi:hypothetical protein